MNTRFTRQARFATWSVLFALILGLAAGSPLPAHAAPPRKPEAALPTAWTALEDAGLSGTVNAIAVDGTNVYVGGSFTQSYNGAVSQLYNIARYDTVAGTWSPVGVGLNGVVRALAVNPTTHELYVGGDFTDDGNNVASPRVLNHIA